jgi:pilus assembly protein Flp/PilA
MNAITQKFVDFIKEEEGLTTVEYAIAGALVGLAVVTAFTDLGTAVGDTIRDIIDAIDPPAAP